MLEVNYTLPFQPTNQSILEELNMTTIPVLFDSFTYLFTYYYYDYYDYDYYYYMYLVTLHGSLEKKRIVGVDSTLLTYFDNNLLIY